MPKAMKSWYTFILNLINFQSNMILKYIHMCIKIRIEVSIFKDESTYIHILLIF